MRKKPKCETSRVQPTDYLSPQYADYGMFLIPFNGANLRVMSSGHDLDSGWEHVSVSLEDRCPIWPEMCFIKNLFWPPEEAVVQFHPSASKRINVHNFCLHMWRPLDGSIIAMPPSICV